MSITKYRKNTINYCNGDIFQSIEKTASAGNNGCSIVVPHVCNNIDKFGAGFTSSIIKNYPIVKENFHMLGSKAVLGYNQYVKVFKDKVYNHEIIFANMIAQNGTLSDKNKRPLNYLALSKCMYNLYNYVANNLDKDNRVQIHAPKFGCGLAGGNWNFIENLIEDIWGDLSVFIYNYNPKITKIK